MGITTLISLALNYQHTVSAKYDEASSLNSYMASGLITSFARPALALGIGYILTLFM